MMNSLYLVATTAAATGVASTATAAAGLVRTSSGFVTTPSTLYPPTQAAATTRTTTFRRHWTMTGKNKLINSPMMMERRDLSSSSSSDGDEDEDETALPASKKSKKGLPYPRAAVAVAVRCCYDSTATTTTTLSANNQPYYLLVQRGNPPNAGRWSFPGGKLELGETTLDGARRELAEETEFRWNNRHDIVGSSTPTSSSVQSDVCSLQWYLDGSWTTADSIVFASSETTDKGQEEKPQSNLLAHYLIGLCFAEIKIPPALMEKKPSLSYLPAVQAMDDAADAKWFTIQQIDEMQSKQETTPGIFDKVQRAELLYQNGMLPTSD